MTTGRINQIALGFYSNLTTHMPPLPDTTLPPQENTPPPFTESVIILWDGGADQFRERQESEKWLLSNWNTCGLPLSYHLTAHSRILLGSPRRTNTDDSPNLLAHGKGSESVRHSIVAYSLFPSPNTSLKESTTNSQGAFFTLRQNQAHVFTFSRKATRLDQGSWLHFPSADVVSEMCGFHA